MPHGWHQVDNGNRPIMYVHVGESQVKSLMSCIKSIDILITYVIKQLEETTREKFYKWQWDQFVLVLDMKGAKLKDMQSSNTQSIVMGLTELFKNYYPCIIYKIFVMNAPMFFEEIWEDLNEQVGEDSTDYKQFIISSKNTHPELTNLVSSENLPKAYGGTSKFDLERGLFTEVGPWSSCSELIWIGEDNKFEDADDDLDEGIDIYDQDLKSAIHNIPSFPGGPMMKHNTKIIGNDSSDIRFNLDALGELINQTPNATPMNTHADDED